MSLIGLNNDSNVPNNVNEYGDTTGYSENHKKKYNYNI